MKKISIIIFLLSSCYKEPDIPVEPRIEFRDISIGSTSSNQDTMIISIYFEDGNGDLGLDEDETNGIYADSIIRDSRITPNKFSNNYFISILKKEQDDYSVVNILDNQSFDGRFPKLNDTLEERPITGTINYTLNIFYDIFGSPLSKEDTVKFRISIADRNLNVSNEIETDIVVIGTN